MALVNILLKRREQNDGLIAYQITDMTLLCIGVLTVFIAFFQMRNLALRKLTEENIFDRNLLLIGLVSVLFYDLFLLVPAAEGYGSDHVVGILFICKAALEFFQALLQVSNYFKKNLNS